MLTSANQVYDWVEENKRSALEVSPDVSLAEFYVVGYRQGDTCLQHTLTKTHLMKIFKQHKAELCSYLCQHGWLVEARAGGADEW